jgi:hypothetical protein
MSATASIFFFDWTQMGSGYGKQAFTGIYAALQRSRGICAFNDGDLFMSKDSVRHLAEGARRIVPASIPERPASPLTHLATGDAFAWYAVGMWTDHSENCEILHEALVTSSLAGYLGFIALDGDVDRNSFDGFLRTRCALPRSIIMVDGLIIPETSKYGLGDTLTWADRDLLWAAAHGDLDAVETALAKGANVNCQMPAERGECPLMRAVCGASRDEELSGRVAVVRRLLAAGADPDAFNGSNSVLMLAVRGGREEIVQALLEGGADANFQGLGGSTAMNEADYDLRQETDDQVKRARQEIWKLLKKHGAVSRRQDTPFDPKRASDDLERARKAALESVSEIGGKAREELERFFREGNCAALELSVAYATEALMRREYYAPENVAQGVLLGRTLRERFLRRGSLHDLQTAIQLFEHAVNTMDPTRHDVVAYWTCLAVALLDRYWLMRNADDLRRSVELQRLATDCAPRGTAEYALGKSNLCNALLTLYEAHAQDSDLLEAVWAGEAAVQESPEDDRNHDMYLCALGWALTERYRRYGNLSDLAVALESLRSAGQKALPSSPSLAVIHTKLAECQNLLHQAFGLQQDLDGLLESLAIATREGLVSMPGAGLQSACAWLSIAFDARRWQEVEAAYALVDDAIVGLLERQVYNDQADPWLANVQGLAAHAAYASAQLGRPGDAALILEQGLARQLNRLLARDRADLALLTDAGHAPLCSMYTKALEKLNQLDRQPRQAARDLRARQDAIADLTNAIEQIRKVPGLEHFAARPDRARIAAAARSGPLIYLAATRAGGFAIVVGSAGSAGSETGAKTIWLPGLPLAAVESALRGQDVHGVRKAGYLDIYGHRRSSTADEEMHRWRATIDEVTQWLWAVAMKDIVGVVEGLNCVTLIPVGAVACLPWHAAALPEDRRAPGRSHVLDLAPLRFAPSALSLVEAERIALLPGSLRLLAVEPQSTDAPPLAFSSTEVQLVRSLFPESHLLSGSRATVDAVIEQLPHHEVFHFAGHGTADLTQPLTSGLLLAQGEWLTLERLLTLRSHGARLAVLSACETGVIGTALPDELMSLPVGMMIAGTAGVVASLWAVDDLSTALLMVRFYWLWRARGLAPASSLREAQRWLRNATNAEITDFCGETLGARGTAASRDIMRRPPGKESYSHPYYWAPFILVGT